jgi:hypothetical protein
MMNSTADPALKARQIIKQYQAQHDHRYEYFTGIEWIEVLGGKEQLKQLEEVGYIIKRKI